MDAGEVEGACDREMGNLVARGGARLDRDQAWSTTFSSCLESLRARNSPTRTPGHTPLLLLGGPGEIGVRDLDRRPGLARRERAELEMFDGGKLEPVALAATTIG